MRRKRFQIGSVAVLFSVVLLCVAVFAVLTVLTASTDVRLAERYGEHVRGQYACESMGQEWLGAVDGWIAGKNPLPEGTALDGETVTAELSDGKYTLSAKLRLTEAGYEISRWSCVTNWQPDENWSLWQGEK